MKIILSRKGFDSSFGGVPSPILEDGTILTFPIPENTECIDYSIKYQDLKPYDLDLGSLINDLAKPHNMHRNHKIQKPYTIKKDDIVHLDPDICISSLANRNKDWKGLLGQCGAAQGHLINQCVDKGDIFLFYGLFQNILQDKVSGQYKYDNSGNHKPEKIHFIWGWMQIGDIININSDKKLKYQWAEYHAHYHFKKPATNNTLYIAKDTLILDNKQIDGVKGFGTFGKYREELQLSDPDFDKTSFWRLPAWMYKNGQDCPLSYNAKRPWKLENGFARLQAYPRGQEFVLNCDNFPEVSDWIQELITQM
jgi:hypothetical protein